MSKSDKELMRSQMKNAIAKLEDCAEYVAGIHAAAEAIFRAFDTCPDADVGPILFNRYRSNIKRASDIAQEALEKGYGLQSVVEEEDFQHPFKVGILTDWAFEVLDQRTLAEHAITELAIEAQHYRDRV